MKQIQESKIMSIESYDVKDLDVYNIELESKSNEDDLFYYDVDSKLIHHNCLRKDFAMINECFPQTDIILQAYKIHEFMPKFLVDQLNSMTYTNANIGILGYTFKANTDDVRDSLVPKLIRYISSHSPKTMYINDPNLPLHCDDTLNNIAFSNASIDEIIDKCSIIFIATNHDEYKQLDINRFKGKIVIDFWGVLGKNLKNFF
jgi:UDP-N-acetyl-D-mannosaminuronic acid dehydrogenase